MDLGPDLVAAIDMLPESMLFASVDGVILAANAALSRQLGVERSSFVHRELAQFAVDAPGAIAEYLQSCARSRQLVLGALTLRHSDGGSLKFRAGGAIFPPSATAGSTRVVLVRLVPTPESESAFIVLNEKIRELNVENARRRLSEDALLKERETLQVTLSSIGDAVIVTGDQGAITFLNEVAEKLVDRKLEWARGRPTTDVFRLIHELEQRPVEDPVQQVLRTGTIVGFADHTVLVRPDGKTIPIDVSAAPIRLMGKVIGAVLIFRDISARRKAEQDLREADRRKDEFLATLAHELRNPLAPIRNAIQIMSASRSDPESEAAAKARAVIERQLKNMVRLIDDLMDMSRITQGRLELRPERVDLDCVVRAAAETCWPLFEAKKQRLRIDAAAAPITVHADVTRLAQAFSNLLHNSAKYSPAGSEICVTLRRDGNSALVEIADKGIGISPAMIPRIFDMFVQLNTPGPRDGLGVGLTLVRRIVELHGGTVEASSDGEGTGSRFSVRLVLAQPETPKEAVDGHGGAPRSTAPRVRILVADDNRDSADTLAMLLEFGGHEVRKAYDGLAALELAEQFRPQIALLDIGMPQMDGYQTARGIRDRAWGNAVFLVALTGWGQDQDRRRAAAAGFDRHLTKPVDPDELARLIVQVKSG
jgi:PAS domain S-box-containing protein